MIERILIHWQARGYGLWALESATTGALLGRCGLQYFPETGENCYTGDEMSKNLDPALLAPIEKIAQFIETGDETLLSAFAETGVVIIENFAPHLFEGANAVARWSAEIRSWHAPPSGLVLKHSFGAVQDLRVRDGLAFLSLPTHWTGLRGGVPFHEDGGWAFVLVQEQGAWRVRCYGWAVTHEEGG